MAPNAIWDNDLLDDNTVDEYDYSNDDLVEEIDIPHQSQPQPDHAVQDVHQLQQAVQQLFFAVCTLYEAVQKNTDKLEAMEAHVSSTVPVIPKENRTTDNQKTEKTRQEQSVVKEEGKEKDNKIWFWILLGGSFFVILLLILFLLLI